MENNGYQQYVEQSVNTMTANELLLLLYDELVKRLVRAGSQQAELPFAGGIGGQEPGDSPLSGRYAGYAV